jgi:hypothetical protein
MTPDEIQKIETGVRILRRSLAPLGLDVELWCRGELNGKRCVCDVVEPYGFVPEADCPIHDTTSDEQVTG